MKKLAFFHDFRAYRDLNKDYYTVGFDYSLWEKYLKSFDEVTVVSRVFSYEEKEDKNNLKISQGQGVKFIPIESYKGIKDFITNKKNIVLEIQKILENVDYVIVRLPSIIGNLAYSEAKKKGKKIIVEVVGCAKEAYWNNSTKGKFVAHILENKMKNIVKDSENVVYVTREFLQKRYPNTKNNIGYSDVFIESLSPKILDERLERNLKEQTVINIGLIGDAVGTTKGHGVTLQALKILKEKYNVKLNLLGHGDAVGLKQKISELGLTDSVNFDGFRTAGKEVWHWLDKMDIYIQPSVQEGLSRSTIEAMSRACPVVTSTSEGFKELIDEQFMVRYSDYQGLAKKIEDFIDNNRIYKEACIKNLEKSKKYSFDILFKTRVDYFNRL